VLLHQTQSPRPFLPFISANGVPPRLQQSCCLVEFQACMHAPVQSNTASSYPSSLVLPLPKQGAKSRPYSQPFLVVGSITHTQTLKKDWTTQCGRYRVKGKLLPVVSVVPLFHQLLLLCSFFLKNYTVQRGRLQHARTLTPMNTRTQILPL
jgi:hypothetical protein